RHHFAHPDPVSLAKEIEDRYRQYLKTTFYFRDPVLRASFAEALDSGHLSKGPYLEATPVFQRGQTPRGLIPRLLGVQPDEDFLKAVEGDRPLYRHQEQAIQAIYRGRNVIVATGTGSGKTEAFLYPILIHLYQEFRARRIGPGVRALILYPMNALANDQRERLGEIGERLKESGSSFRFTFGQYIGETPEDERDSRRHATDHSSPWWKGRLSRSREECTLRARRGQSSVRNGHHTLRSLAFESRRRLAVVARPTRGSRGSPADPEASRSPAAGASPGTS